jgi:hypothetical protein
MGGKRRRRPGRGGTASQGEAVDMDVTALLASLPPERAEAVTRAAEQTAHVILTQGAVNTTLSEETLPSGKTEGAGHEAVASA